MVDIRYHIYSLAAVFLALAVGIVIGASFVKGSPSGDTSRKTIQRYERDMDTLKTEITQTTTELADRDETLKNWQDFCRALMPTALKGKLTWRNVTIIRTGDYNELSGTIKQALEMAGAPVTSITELSRTFPFEDNTKIAQLLNSRGLAPGDQSIDSREKLLNIIVNGLCTGKQSDSMSKLEGSGIGAFTGDYDRVNKLVVLIGGSSDDTGNTSDTLDAQIISRFQKQGVRVVACEPTEAGSSYIAAWRKMGIATVDNVDSAMGQIALVYALAGERGNFGVKDTADRLIPRTMETETR